MLTDNAWMAARRRGQSPRVGDIFLPMPFAYYDNLSRDERRIYDASDRIRALRLADPSPFTALVETVRGALESARPQKVQVATQELIDALNEAFRLPRVKVHVLLTRPKSAESELHGLYTHEPGRRPRIEVWMRTAAHGRVVAFRTFLRTVLHEFCHHFDFAGLGFDCSFHTQGFFRRESSLMNQIAPKTTRAPGGSVQPVASARLAAPEFHEVDRHRRQ